MMIRRTILELALSAAATILVNCAVNARAETESPKTGVGDAMIRHMIGQMVLVGFVGDKIEDEGFRTVVAQAGQGRIGGVIYLRRNIRSLRAIANLNHALQEVSEPPLFIAVDQEGGRIERLTKDIGFEEVPSAATVARLMSPDEAGKIYAEMAGDLAAIGINLNLGPVVDLNVNPDNPIIGRLGRSFSSKGETVSNYARSFVRAHRAQGVLTSLKHFPGHGSSFADTHKGTADVTGTWSNQELQPYKDLIESGDAPMIMSAHVVNRNIPGAEDTPASMSKATLVGLLRNQLKFKGVVVSDDLQMDAIAMTRGLEDTVRQAVRAGNDILVFANDKHPDPGIPETISDLLLMEARQDPEILSRIQQSYWRIVRLKAELSVALPFRQRPN